MAEYTGRNRDGGGYDELNLPYSLEARECQYLTIRSASIRWRTPLRPEYFYPPEHQRCTV